MHPAPLRTRLFSHAGLFARSRRPCAPACALASARALAPALALALAFALLPAFPLHAQQADPPQKPPPPKSRAFKTPAAENPFAMQVVPWFSLAPPGATLIRPGPQGSLDLAAREDQTYITVFGKKKLVDPRTDREHDYSAATWSDVGLPKDIPIGPPGNCSSGAYRTIGGQAATGADLMGGLGGGRC